MFYTTSAKRKMILAFISHLVWEKIKLFDMNRVGQDMWPLWSEIYKTLPKVGKQKLLDGLFALIWNLPCQQENITRN